MVETARRARATGAPHGVAVPFALLLAVVAGGLAAVQSRVNADLGTHLGAPLLAGVISNTGGMLALLTVYALRRRTRDGLRRVRGSGQPWWRYLGGICGSTLVAGATFVVPKLGVALFTVGLVAGQTTGGLAVDKVGLGPGGPRPVTVVRVLGAAIALGAVAVSRWGEHGAVSVPYIVAAAGIGVLIAVQLALNGHVQQAARDPLAATFINFAVGTVALVLVFLAAFDASRPNGEWTGEWWLYGGGLLGIGVVVASVVAVRPLGVLRLGLAVIAGQLTAAVALDLTVPSGGTGVTANLLVGVVLTFVAVAVAGRGRLGP